MPEPQTEFTNGLPSVEGKGSLSNHWQEAVNALNEAIVEARHQPRNRPLAVRRWHPMGERDPESLERLRAIFAKEGIPRNFCHIMSQNRPFACLRLNDGLSDKF